MYRVQSRPFMFLEVVQLRANDCQQFYFFNFAATIILRPKVINNSGAKTYPVQLEPSPANKRQSAFLRYYTGMGFPPLSKSMLSPSCAVNVGPAGRLPRGGHRADRRRRPLLVAHGPGVRRPRGPGFSYGRAAELSHESHERPCMGHSLRNWIGWQGSCNTFLVKGAALRCRHSFVVDVPQFCHQVI